MQKALEKKKRAEEKKQAQQDSKQASKDKTTAARILAKVAPPYPSWRAHGNRPSSVSTTRPRCTRRPTTWPFLPFTQTLP